MRTEILEGFLVLEGLDGAGTTTQLDRLRRHFDADGARAWCTCEPTDGPVGLLIRAALRREVALSARTLALLFAADRWEHLYARGGGIRDRLGRGEIVVSDRYLFSSLAYQGDTWGFAEVMHLHRDYPLPGDVIYIDTPVEVCQQRIGVRAGRELFDEESTQRRVAAGYERAFRELSGTGIRVHRLDGTLPPAQIADQVWKVAAGLPIIGT
jgi:dTMP kinase